MQKTFDGRAKDIQRSWDGHSTVVRRTFDGRATYIHGGAKKSGTPSGLMLTQEGPTFFAPPCTFDGLLTTVSRHFSRTMCSNAATQRFISTESRTKRLTLFSKFPPPTTLPPGRFPPHTTVPPGRYPPHTGIIYHHHVYFSVDYTDWTWGVCRALVPNHSQRPFQTTLSGFLAICADQRRQNNRLFS